MHQVPRARVDSALGRLHAAGLIRHWGVSNFDVIDMRRLLVWAVLVCMTVAVRATVLVPIEFRELVTIATVIAHGRVTDAHGEWTDGIMYGLIREDLED